MKLKCRCGNQKEFRIQGSIIDNVENKVSGEGVITEIDQPEPFGFVKATYQVIACPECGVEVDGGDSKEEADKIILGAYEILKKE